MDVRFYDYEHNLIAIVAHKQSVNWQLYYNDIGTFELHMAMSEAQAEKILNNDYLVAVQGDLAAVIVEKQVSGNDLAIFGRTCNWLLTKRVVTPFESSSDVIEMVKSLTPEYMDFENDTVTESESTFSVTSMQSVSDFVIEYFNEHSFGHEVLFSLGDDGAAKWIFRAYEGEERDIIMSESARTASEMTYTDSLLEYASEGVYSETKEDSDGNTTIEYVTVKKDDKEGIYKTEISLDAQTKEAAESELEEKKWIRSSEGTMRRYRFGEDYYLGDIVSLQFERGKFRRSNLCRVEGVHIWEEAQSSGEEPILEVIE
jgi:hypothetical protein